MASKEIEIVGAEQPYVDIDPMWGGRACVTLSFARAKRGGSYDYYTVKFVVDSDDLACIGSRAIRGVDAIGRQMWSERNNNVNRIKEAVE